MAKVNNRFGGALRIFGLRRRLARQRVGRTVGAALGHLPAMLATRAHIYCRRGPGRPFGPCRRSAKMTSTSVISTPYALCRDEEPPIPTHSDANPAQRPPPSPDPHRLRRRFACFIIRPENGRLLGQHFSDVHSERSQFRAHGNSAETENFGCPGLVACGVVHRSAE